MDQLHYYASNALTLLTLLVGGSYFWGYFRRKVEDGLERLDEKIEGLGAKVDKVENTVDELKTKIAVVYAQHPNPAPHRNGARKKRSTR